jgi:hypothetical protein
MKDKIVKPDYSSEIGAALAVIRLGEAVTSAPAPEIFDLYCFCAVYDKPYTLRFTRQPSGLLRFAASIKGQPSSLPGNCRAGGIGWTLNLDYFESTAAPCAWCGDQTFNHCRSYCGSLVCGGRINGNTFHCRKSCGASWIGKPLQEVKGCMRCEPLLASRVPSSPLRKPAALPPKPLLLLGSGYARRGK